MKRIILDLTYDCNMKCPWCVARYVGAEKLAGQISESSYAKVMEHLKQEQYDLYTFHGGEPLLYPELLKRYIKDIKAIKPKAKMMLYTNGTLITQDIAFLLNDNNVHACISLNAEGYKGLMHFIQTAPDAEEIFKTIRQLRSYDIRVVKQRFKPFAYESLLLHNIFMNCSINTVPDYTTLKDWTQADIDFIRKELTLLKDKAKYFYTWHTLMQGFKHGCDCTDKKHYYLVTEDVREDPEATNTQSGCSFFRRNMPIHLYTQYQDLCEEFYGGKNNVSNNR